MQREVEGVWDVIANRLAPNYHFGTSQLDGRLDVYHPWPTPRRNE